MDSVFNAFYKLICMKLFPQKNEGPDAAKEKLDTKQPSQITMISLEDDA